MGVKPAFKRTEVGVIPEDWGIKKIREIGEVRGRVGWKGYTKKDLVTSGPYAIGAKHIDRQCRLDLSDPTHLSREKYLESPEIMVQTGDVLLVQRGTIGKLVLVEEDIGEATINPSMVIVRTTNSSPSFIRYFLLSRQGQEQIILDTSTTGVPMISQRQIENFRIAYPPLPEQRVIAAALGEVDALLVGLDRLFVKKSHFKQAAMQHLLTGQTRLPGFQGEWEVKRLLELADVDPDNLGAGTAPDYSFKYISLENVDYGVLRGFSEEVFETAPSRARRKLRHGDVLVSTVRPNLKSHLLFDRNEDDWVCSTGFAVVRAKSGQSHPGFLFAHIFAYDVSRQIEALLTGSSYPAINSADVRCLEIPAPAYEEQAAIAAVLSDMDAELSAIEARLTKTRAIKQGMMQELLTGRTRLIDLEATAA